MTDAPDEVKLTRRLGEDRLVALLPGETMSMGFLGPVHKYVRADIHAAAVARAEKAEAHVAELVAALAQVAHQWNAMQDYAEGLHRRLGIDAPDAWAEAFKPQP